MLDLPYSPPEDGAEPDQVVDLSQALAPDPDTATEITVNPDGSVTVLLGPASTGVDPASLGHGDNLALALGDYALALIAEDLLEGIRRDDESRAEWLETRAEGIKLLGLKMERPGASGDGLDGMSTVRHPVLLEAVVRHQANASAELLPADGIVKVRDDGQTQSDDALATALERGMNHYLTVTAPEYREETERMLLWSGFGGLGLKKVYLCPLRRRPVSEMVDAADLIVSNNATDIQNAPRVTHRITMDPITLRRMQILKAYRDVDLGDAGMDDRTNAVDQEMAEVEGIAVGTERPEDRERTIFECYCFLDLDGFKHQDTDGSETGLPLPYKVTIDEASRHVLEIRRNWIQEEGEALPRRKQVFVPFTFIPGMGFYGIGLVHLLGNLTSALTGLTRITIDAGMFGNFPGGLISEDATRQDRLTFTPAPGQFSKVKTGGKPIDQAVMPLPYKTPDQATMDLLSNLTGLGERIGGTAELQVGEGRQDAPVGTTLALIEAANKPMSAVHKRYCAAQAVELGLMLDLFREAPEAFWRGNPRAKIQDEAVLLQALETYDLVPVADPNTASHMQRIQKMQAGEQLIKSFGPLAPAIFDIVKFGHDAMSILQLPNAAAYCRQDAPGPAQLMQMMQKQPPGAGRSQQPPDPVDQQTKLIAAHATAQDSATRAKKADADIALGQARLGLDAHKAQADLGTSPVDWMDAQTRRLQAETAAQGLAVDERNNIRDAQNQAADRQSEDHLGALSFLRGAMEHGNGRDDAHAARQHASAEAVLDREHEASEAALDRRHAAAAPRAGSAK